MPPMSSGPRAPGLYDPADQPDQHLAVRPVVMSRPEALVHGAAMV